AALPRRRAVAVVAAADEGGDRTSRAGVRAVRAARRAPRTRGEERLQHAGRDAPVGVFRVHPAAAQALTFARECGDEDFHVECRLGTRPAAAAAIAELHGVDRVRFENEVMPAGRPVVLRGLVAGWPAVRRGREGPESICRYLAERDGGAAVDAILLRPEEKGR